MLQLDFNPFTNDVIIIIKTSIIGVELKRNTQSQLLQKSSFSVKSSKTSPYWHTVLTNLRPFKCGKNTIKRDHDFYEKKSPFFRQINVFMKEVRNELVSQNFLSVIAFCSTFLLWAFVRLNACSNSLHNFAQFEVKRPDKVWQEKNYWDKKLSYFVGTNDFKCCTIQLLFAFKLSLGIAN